VAYRKRAIWGVVALLAAACTDTAQMEPTVPGYRAFESYNDFKKTVLAVAGLADVTLREKNLSVLWDSLLANQQVPFVLGDSVAFLYKGEATSVAWAGDFNRWSPTFTGQRIGESNLWLVEKTFPADARLDYKLVVNGNWQLDPSNPHIQYSGFGPNSELRMPAWQYPEETIAVATTPKGELSANKVIISNSANLNYAVQYKVYTPYGYEQLANLPVMYITDGHEYADDKLGSMVIVLDNLIHQQRIQPIVVVFVDPRDPANSSTNRRMQEYRANRKFADFLSDELVPAVDAAYKTNREATQRAILGTSLGGWNSAYVGRVRSDVFQRIGIHSPAFDAAIVQEYQAAERLPLKIFMSTGTINDTQNQARSMKSVLEQKGYSLQYVEVNEGHSWGNWRGLLQEPLVYFFPK
jgi:enterochelin esterase-like enzyme